MKDKLQLKSKITIEPGYIWAPYVSMFLPPVVHGKQVRIMKVKDWLKYKNKPIDAEEELARILSEEINKSIIEKDKKTQSINFEKELKKLQAWIKQQS